MTSEPQGVFAAFRCEGCDFVTSGGNVCLGCGEHRDTATIPRHALVRVYERVKNEAPAWLRGKLNV